MAALAEATHSAKEPMHNVARDAIPGAQMTTHYDASTVSSGDDDSVSAVATAGYSAPSCSVRDSREERYTMKEPIPSGGIRSQDG